jgi:alkylation response protein AidB-like acyl-CoA dehydrogenase
VIGAHAMSEPDAGSDAYGLRTSARRVADGWVLSGTKAFVSEAAVADLFLVFARAGDTTGPLGISAFVVDRAASGVVVGPPIEKMGLRTAPMAALTLSECHVPQAALVGREGRGAEVFRDSIEWERACILAGAVGAMERLLEDAIEYAKRRRQFGRSIGSFVPVANRLVEMKLRLETARLVLYRAACAKERDQEPELNSAIAKLVVSAAYRASALDALEVRGGYGYLVEHEVERDVRDALASSIYSGTSEIQRLVIARRLGLGSS